METNTKEETSSSESDLEHQQFMWEEKAPNSFFRDYQAYRAARETPSARQSLMMAKFGLGYIARESQSSVIDAARSLKIDNAREFLHGRITEYMNGDSALPDGLLSLYLVEDFARKIVARIRAMDANWFLGLATELQELKDLRTGELEKPIRSYLDGRRGGTRQTQGKFLRMVEAQHWKLIRKTKGDRLPYHQELVEAVARRTDQGQPKILDAIRKLGIKLPKRPKTVKGPVKKLPLR